MLSKLNYDKKRVLIEKLDSLKNKEVNSYEKAFNTDSVYLSSFIWEFFERWINSLRKPIEGIFFYQDPTQAKFIFTLYDNVYVVDPARKYILYNGEPITKEKLFDELDVIKKAVSIYIGHFKTFLEIIEKIYNPQEKENES